ncbi:hypothetical protein TWF694_002695 [Orbilia ellipsospora]|uniref:Uncharacterized protein n=1 Tax=Orbilia ellipsospora TaxID=2528407 RepID=A0AAV9X325_9PEZI
MDDDFDSDEEVRKYLEETRFERELNEPFPNAGKVSIQKIIDSAAEDRGRTLRAIQNLQLDIGSPSSAYKVKMWMSRFITFYTETLKKDPLKTPSFADIERFWIMAPSVMKPKGPSGKVSVDSVTSGVVSLLQAIIFRYPDFKTSRHASLRIRSVLNDLRKKGVLTTQPSREPQWLGLPVIVQMLATTLSKAYNKGCPSWDIVISRVTSICLVANIGGRAGEVVRSQLYKGDEYMAWKHITMVFLEGDHSVTRIGVVVKLAFQKSEKSNERASRGLSFSSIEADELAPICLPTQILIHALRSGVIQGVSTLEELENLPLRQDRRIIWKPEAMNSPVIRKISPTRTSLTNLPAGISQLASSVKACGSNAGVLASITTHDTRRGAAQDTCKKSGGLDTSEARRMLGHSTKSHHQDVTDVYAGNVSIDMSKKRLRDAGMIDEDTVDAVVTLPNSLLNVTQEGLMLQKGIFDNIPRTSPGEVNKYMDEHREELLSRYKNTKTTRSMVALKIREQKRVDLIEKAKGEGIQTPIQTPLQPPTFFKTVSKMVEDFLMKNPTWKTDLSPEERLRAAKKEIKKFSASEIRCEAPAPKAPRILKRKISDYLRDNPDFKVGRSEGYRRSLAAAEIRKSASNEATATAAAKTLTGDVALGGTNDARTPLGDISNTTAMPLAGAEPHISNQYLECYLTEDDENSEEEGNFQEGNPQEGIFQGGFFQEWVNLEDENDIQEEDTIEGDWFLENWDYSNDFMTSMTRDDNIDPALLALSNRLETLTVDEESSNIPVEASLRNADTAGTSETPANQKSTGETTSNKDDVKNLRDGGDHFYQDFPTMERRCYIKLLSEINLTTSGFAVREDGRRVPYLPKCPKCTYVHEQQYLLRRHIRKCKAGLGVYCAKGTCKKEFPKLARPADLSRFQRYHTQWECNGTEEGRSLVEFGKSDLDKMTRDTLGHFCRRHKIGGRDLYKGPVELLRGALLEWLDKNK